MINNSLNSFNDEEIVFEQMREEDLLSHKLKLKYPCYGNTVLLRFLFSSMSSFNLVCFRSYLRFKYGIMCKEYKLLSLEVFKDCLLHKNAKKHRYFVDVVFAVNAEDKNAFAKGYVLTNEEVLKYLKLGEEIRTMVKKDFLLYTFELEFTGYVFAHIC